MLRSQHIINALADVLDQERTLCIVMYECFTKGAMLRRREAELPMAQEGLAVLTE